MPVTLYTTAEAIESRISTVGADLRTDDSDTDTAANLIASVIEDASVEVNGYCQLLYTPAALAQSAWIRKKTTDIAVFLLCLRRLNPAPQSAQVMYEKAIKDLERIQAGKAQVPDIAARKAMAPVLTNQRVRLKPIPQVVNQPGISTGNPQGYVPHTDVTDPTTLYDR